MNADFKYLLGAPDYNAKSGITMPGRLSISRTHGTFSSPDFPPPRRAGRGVQGPAAPFKP